MMYLFFVFMAAFVVVSVILFKIFTMVVGQYDAEEALAAADQDWLRAEKVKPRYCLAVSVSALANEVVSLPIEPTIRCASGRFRVSSKANAERMAHEILMGEGIFRTGGQRWPLHSIVSIKVQEVQEKV